MAGRRAIGNRATANFPVRNTMFRRLPAEEALAVATGGRHRLRTVFTRADLVAVGFGVMIGAGIFKIAGQQAATVAGPAVLLSFVIAGVVCLLSALSYAELSSTLPIAGSAYSFTYVAFGEIWAWIIGWAMLLELLLAAAVVARAWSLYAVPTMGDLGIAVPGWLEPYVGQTEGFDFFALLVLLVIVGVVAVGSRLSVRALWALVVAKLSVILLVIVVGLAHVRAANYQPFVPEPQPAPEAASGAGRTVLEALVGSTPNVFGVSGIFTAAAAVTFAYIGFDIIATAAEEAENPRTDISRSMVSSLLMTMFLYLGVAIVLVGMRPFARLAGDTPLSDAFRAVGAEFMAGLINVGALLGLTTVILVVVIGQTRVAFAMARDGLLPAPLAAVSSRFRTPARTSLVVGGAAIVLSQVFDVLTLEQMVVIGTMFAFVFVSAGVLVLRRTRPDLRRGFRVPLSPFVPSLAIAATVWLMLNLHVKTWVYFAGWMTVGLLVYLLYGRRNSRLSRIISERTGPLPGGRRGRHRAPVPERVT